jgi:hypothetical protein
MAAFCTILPNRLLLTYEANHSPLWERREP